MSVSNKRGSDDISPSTEKPKGQSEEDSSPKRSKLDFLAMIAGMSEKSDDDEAKAEAAPGEGKASAEPAAAAVSTKDSKPKFKNSEDNPLAKKASPTKGGAPKSSFAAWKLAKGRKNGVKSPNRKEISVGRKDISVVNPAPAANGDQQTDLLVASVKKPCEEATAGVPTSEVATKKVVLGLLPPPKKSKKDQLKKSLSPKKAGSSHKKDKDRDGLMSPKKAAKKAAALAAKNGVKPVKVKSKKGDQAGLKAAAFPEKIMDLLQGGLADNAIYWLPEGEAIAVDPDKFKDSTIISKQFRGNKLSSFVRSLNRWGFRRIFYHSLPDKTLAFYHRLFQKQSPELVKQMKMDGGEKEPALPAGALPATAASDGSSLPGVEATQHLESPKVARPAMLASMETTIPNSPAASASLGAPPAQAATPAQPAPAIGATAAGVPPEANLLEFAAAAEGQHALQQAMVAEQERSDLALQQLQAQQIMLQSLAEQQNSAQAEELLMQSMIAEQQRSDMAMQQRQAEQQLIQQMLAEEQTSALAAAFGGGGGAGGGMSSVNAEAWLREQLMAQQYGNAAAPAQAPGAGSDVLALLQQQLQGHHQQQQQQAQAREPSYMEQLLMLEQQQQQQRQQEAALLAARGYRRFG